MKVTIDRSLCDHALPACEACFGRFIRNPQSVDRTCITDYMEDDDPLLTLTLKYDGRQEVLFLTPEDRELAASEGWSRFVAVPPKFYRE